jgi:hypothetical protein
MGGGVVGPLSLTCSNSRVTRAPRAYSTYYIFHWAYVGGGRPYECRDFCRDRDTDFVEIDGGDAESDDLERASRFGYQREHSLVSSQVVCGWVYIPRVVIHQHNHRNDV